jgi:peptidoglycan DL-endopeptidase CwlO
MLLPGVGLLNVSRSGSSVVPPLAGLSALVVLIASLPVLLASGASSPSSVAVASPPVCLTSGKLSGLSDAAAANARVVAAVAFARAVDQAALIALMVGVTESGLRALGNPNDATAVGLTSEGIGTDHDSIGIFQQRPSWGSAEQRMDPVLSTNLFLDRLLATPQWTTTEPWVVAQAVQVSAFDGIPRPANGFSSDVGSNYRAVLPEASRILGAIEAGSIAPSCSTAVFSPPRH